MFSCESDQTLPRHPEKFKSSWCACGLLSTEFDGAPPLPRRVWSPDTDLENFCLRHLALRIQSVRVQGRCAKDSAGTGNPDPKRKLPRTDRFRGVVVYVQALRLKTAAHVFGSCYQPRGSRPLSVREFGTVPHPPLTSAPTARMRNGGAYA